MNTYTQNPAPTFESVWALLQENALQMQKYRDDYERQRAEYDRKVQESRADYERQRADYDNRMKKFEETMGGWSNNHGKFAEEYFFNSFENGQKNFFGKKFDKINKNLKWENITGLKDEYDIVMYNKTAVAIVEVKFTLRKDDVKKVEKKANTFRILAPDYKDFDIYLGLASMVFPAHIEQECIKKGIAVIKQVGDKIVINDEHLKVF